VILDRRSGAPRQRLPLPEEGSALAADATGTWLAAGTTRGTRRRCVKSKAAVGLRQARS